MKNKTQRDEKQHKGKGLGIKCDPRIAVLGLYLKQNIQNNWTNNHSTRDTLTWQMELVQLIIYKGMKGVNIE